MQNAEKPTKWYRWWFSAGELAVLALLGTTLWETVTDEKWSVGLRATVFIVVPCLMALLVLHIWRGRIRKGSFGRYPYQVLPENERRTVP
jgi:hypothetical protein